MSETPERIEREMFEIRSRMSSDIKDLHKHLESQIVVEQVKQTVRQRTVAKQTPSQTAGSRLLAQAFGLPGPPQDLGYMRGVAQPLEVGVRAFRTLWRGVPEDLSNLSK